MLHALNAFLLTGVQCITGLPDCPDPAAPAGTAHSDNTNVGLAKLFLFLLSLGCVVYARALYFPVLGIDTFTYALSEGYGDIYFEILRGTWGFTFLNQLFHGPLVSPLVSMFAFLLITTTAVFVVTVFWTGTKPDWRACCTGAIMVLFPYWASQAYFSYYHYGYSLATLGGVLGVVLPWHRGGWRRCAMAAGCVVMGASMYQGSVTIASGLVGATLLVAVVNTFLHRPQARCTWRSLTRVGLVLLAGGAAYLLTHKAVLLLAGMSSLNNGYSVRLDISLSRLLEGVQLVIPGSPLLVSGLAAWLMAVPLLLFVLSLFERNGCVDKPCFASRRVLLWFPPVAALALFSPIWLNLIQPHRLASRSTGSVAFVWGAVFLLAALAGLGRWKKCLSITAVLLCVCFAARINYVWQLQTLTTEADMSDARRMFQRLIDLPEYAQAAKPLDVTFVGCLAGNARSWPQDYEAIFGLSQFACFGSNTWPAHPGAVLRFVGGPMKIVPQAARDIQVASTRTPWPAAESVFWNGDHAVIWLGPPTRQQVDIRLPIARIAELMGIAHETAPASQNTAPSPLLQRIKRVDGPWSGEHLRPLVGRVEVETPLSDDPRHMRVRGWAFDLQLKIQPSYVALLNCNGQMVGAAATGLYRQDLLQRVAVDAEYAGFEGFALKGEKICAIAY